MKKNHRKSTEADMIPPLSYAFLPSMVGYFLNEKTLGKKLINQEHQNVFPINYFY
jgi:hypothetical protein